MQALNAILRLTWVETTMHFHIRTVENHLLDFFLASLEVVRRGHWNFYRYHYQGKLCILIILLSSCYISRASVATELVSWKIDLTFNDNGFIRLENEQMNNAGNFRAVKAVPLPFNEMD